MSNRTYPRNEATYDRKLIDMMVADGMAVPMNGAYIVKTGEEDGTIRSFIVRPHQIIDYPPAAFTIMVNGVPFDDNAAEADLADRELADSSIQDYIRLAANLNISVEEFTDGEYYVNNGRVFSAEERRRYLKSAR